MLAGRTTFGRVIDPRDRFTIQPWVGVEQGVGSQRNRVTELHQHWSQSLPQSRCLWAGISRSKVFTAGRGWSKLSATATTDQTQRQPVLTSP